MLKDVNAEKMQLTGIVDSLEKTLAEKDDEIRSLKTEASLNTSHSHSAAYVISQCLG